MSYDCTGEPLNVGDVVSVVCRVTKTDGVTVQLEGIDPNPPQCNPLAIACDSMMTVKLTDDLAEAIGKAAAEHAPSGEQLTGAIGIIGAAIIGGIAAVVVNRMHKKDPAPTPTPTPTPTPPPTPAA